jgi:Tol biopolymer transport system component/DNA-binding winged helix-turn-helix (wHTH) protein
LSYTSITELRFELATNPSSRASACFDRFQVDLSSGELLRSGIRVPIQDQPFQVLRLLLEAEGRVVTRDQLRSALWPEDTFVDFEHGVNTAVKKLRQALEDSAESPKFVETLPKFGYRFIVRVEWVAEESGNSPLRVVPIAPPGPPVPQLVPQPRKWKWMAVIAVAATAVITAGALLSNDNSYLSRTRMGTWLRQPLVGRNSEPLLSQRRLTANPDDTPLTGGVISPDGKYVAYSDASGFYLRQVDGGETHAMPLPNGFHPLPESWFPDSAHLVVSWFDDPQKGPPSPWKISVMGGAPRKLAEEGSSARVSPDGSKIAFLQGKWDNEEIWLMDADGNNARKIVDGGQDNFGAVAWAPDAKRFACVRTTTTKTGKQIEVYDVTSGRSEVILSESRLGNEIAWMNTGRLIYSLDEAEPNQSDSNLWWVQLDPRTGHSSGPSARITNDRGSIAGISVAVDGNRMALLRGAFQADVYLTDIEAQNKRLTTPRRFTLDERWDWPNSWTPDSKAVLFTSDRDGPSHIFKQSIDQTQPELLVGGKDVLTGPRLTPDGLSALYVVSAMPGEPSENLRLMRVPLSGGPSQFVLEVPGLKDYQCARLPSTLCIYGEIESKSEYVRFFSFDPAGAKGTELLIGKMKTEGGPDFWNLSPDGKYLVTAKSQDPYQAPTLRIFDLADATERYIPVPRIGLITGMDWAANSKSIWVGGYMGRGAWGTRSGVLNVALSGRVKVALDGLNPTIWFAIPSPDGRRLALGGNTQSSNMWLLENF